MATPIDLTEMLNRASTGWVHEMGLRFTIANADEVRCEFDAGEHHLQAYGIVHGGVHAGVIETLASVGAAAAALPRDQAVVGLENSTSFIRAVRAGARLHAVGTPITRGRKSQVWEGRIYDEEERLVAIGRVRLLCIPREEGIAGGEAQVPPDRA
ncbi:MAG TPA: PaaI family thioesterase [Candidatus Dormibacteraeota bacterium]